MKKQQTVITKTTATKVLPLLRVSSKDQTFPRQVATVQYIVSRFHLEALEALELKVSGAYVQDSDDFNDMLDRLSDPSIAGVVVSSLDRFFRPASLKSYFVTLQPFIEHAKVIYTKDGIIDPATDEGLAIIFAKGQAANSERKAIVERTSDAKNIYRTIPQRKTDPIPVGVTFNPTTEKFSYTAESARIKEAFERFTVQCHRLATITKDLKFASQSALRSILKNFWWIGYKASFVVDGVKLESPRLIATNLADAPLVSRSTFDHAQEIMSKHTVTWTQRKNRVEEFLGSGLVHCACGAKMYAQTDQRRGYAQYYVCADHHRKLKVCDAPNHRISIKRADKEIMFAAVSTFGDKKFVALSAAQAKNHEATAQIDREIVGQRKVIKTAEKKTANVTAMIADFGYTDDAKSQLKAQVQIISEAKNEIRNLQSKVVAQVSPDAIASELQMKFLHFMLMPLSEQKAQLADCVEAVTFDANGNAKFALKVMVTTPRLDAAENAHLGHVKPENQSCSPA